MSLPGSNKSTLSILVRLGGLKDKDGATGNLDLFPTVVAILNHQVRPEQPGQSLTTCVQMRCVTMVPMTPCRREENGLYEAQS
jgi:hypothetical protein